MPLKLKSISENARVQFKIRSDRLSESGQMPVKDLSNGGDFQPLAHQA